METLAETTALDLARECLYRYLAAALTDPQLPGWRLILVPENQNLAREAADFLREEAAFRPTVLGPGELPSDQLVLEPLLEELRQPPAIAADYDRIFGLVTCRECPPYETEYLPASETFFRSQQLADIAGFYRAFGIESAQAAPERPDHIALELEFLAFLLLKRRLALSDDEAEAATKAQVCDDAEQSFFREHLVWWVPAFATGLRRKADTGFYAALAHFLAAFITVERGQLDVPPSRFPLHASLIERPEEQAGCAGCTG
jgi:TorA maturation chaperone TorD